MRLSRSARRQLAQTLPPADAGQASGQALATAGNLAGLLLDRKPHIAARGTNRYVAARSEELRFLDEEVLVPLIRLARFSGSADWKDADRSELCLAAAAARTLGYEVRVIHDSSSRDEFLLLAETLGETSRSWGTYALRCGLTEPFVVEVPRPLAEKQTVEFGVSLLGRIRAAAMLVAGAHPQANLDGSADITRTANRVNMFHLVHQVLLRELGPRAVQVVQVRASQELVDADLLVATSEGKTRADDLDPLTRRLLSALDDERLCIRFVRGDRETTSYEPDTVQLAAMNLTSHKSLTTLWLVPEVRREYEIQGDNQLQEAQFQAVGIPTVQATLEEYLTAARSANQRCVLPETLRCQIEEYAVYHDIVRLQQLCLQWPQFQFMRLLDVGSQQAFLLIRRQDGDSPAVVALQANGSRVVTGGSACQPAAEGMTRSESARESSWEVAIRP